MATLEVPESGRGNPDGWRALIRPPHLGPMLVLAGGVALYAINVYLTTSLLPSAVEEIGGSRLYAWNTTVFLLASVMSSVLVGRLLASRSGRVAYLLAIGLFVVGTLICAAAPTMVVLLLGRAVQGFGGGLLAGLAYALIRSTLPAALWSRGSALVSAMWGVGTFIGPALGGAFAQYGSWRGAFWALALVGLLIAAAVPLVLSTARTGEGPAGFPLVALILLSAAALVISVASLIATPTVSVLGVLLGAGLVVAFLGYERRAQRAPSRVRVLPAATFAGRSALPWIYLTIALLSIGSTTETFVPLFGQRLLGLAPLAAGFLGAALAAGWTLGELPSAEASRPVVTERIAVAAPLVLAFGLAMVGALALCTGRTDSGWVIGGWVLALLIAGAGIGIAWPHLATGAMSAVHDPAEGDKASAAINTVQLVANAFGASLTGVAVNLAGTDLPRAAGYLFGGFAVLTALGVGASVSIVIATRRAASS